MSSGSLFSLNRALLGPPMQTIHHIVSERQNALNRVLNFTGHTIDDVINNPRARTTVRGYFKMYKNIERHGDIVDLERQWNARS